MTYKEEDRGYLTPCWIWQVDINIDGYGWLHVARKTTGAHCFMYEKKHGKIPKGMQLNHLCRVRCCVNPDHLEVVTIKINVQKGKSAKVNAKEACEIRDLFLRTTYKQREIAKLYGISQQQVSDIVINKCWS